MCLCLLHCKLLFNSLHTSSRQFLLRSEEKRVMWLKQAMAHCLAVTDVQGGQRSAVSEGVGANIPERQ